MGEDWYYLIMDMHYCLFVDSNGSDLYIGQGTSWVNH
jgi:hypothetical protein